VHGAAILLPAATLPCLYSESMRMPFFHIDDVFVAGFAAERCGFPRRKMVGFVEYGMGVTATARDILLLNPATAFRKEKYFRASRQHYADVTVDSCMRSLFYLRILATVAMVTKNLGQVRRGRGKLAALVNVAILLSFLCPASF
jgi:hypothetical protein